MTKPHLVPSIERLALRKTAVAVEDSNGVEVEIMLKNSDLTAQKACASLRPNASDSDIALAIVRCVNGIAAIRGPELVSAIDRLVTIR